MTNEIYRNWLTELKTTIRARQIKAALAVNTELIRLYWDIGKSIVTQQETHKWGSKLIPQLSKDLKAEFPDLGGFSVTNLKYCRIFYLFYSTLEIGQQAVDQFDKRHNVLNSVPWGHHIVIMQTIKNKETAWFYLRQTIEHNWSRNVLSLQMESNLYERQGKAITNFAQTLPQPQSDLAQQIIKDPYNFDFLTLPEAVRELEIERQLVNNITQFLLELGKGFAFIGRQYPLQMGDKHYAIDLLFYHIRLRCFVVVDLKVGTFKPEYIGKMNFYLSLTDNLLKGEGDQPSMGIIMCKTKDKLEVEFSLKDIHKPIGVSEYKYNELPIDVKALMPTIEELEQEIFPKLDLQDDEV